MASSTIPCEVTISPPNLQKLVAVRLNAHRDLLEHYSSFHQAVAAIVRSLVVNNPDILACPGLCEADFYIIMREDNWQDAGWREDVKSVNLEVIQDGGRVSTDLFADCVWYTTMCRLAPEWNRVGDLFIRGSEFFAGASGRKYNALDVTVVCLPSDRLNLKLMAFTTTVSHMISRELGDDSSVATNVIGQQRASCGPMVSATCFVLPKQNGSIIFSSRKNLPASSVFKDYVDVRNYWKSVYGYRLPHAEPEFYCEVIGGLHNTPFTYPSYCLLGKKIELFTTTELERAQCIKAFLTDLRVKMPKLCGVPMKATCLPWAVSAQYRGAFTAGASSFP